MTDITVGLPVYNAESYIEAAIRSIVNQNYTNWTLIIIDDGSTDRSIDIARRFESKRVKVYSDGKNLGLAYRLNQIANIAETPYLARMDADDIMHPDRLHLQRDFLERNPDIDVVGSSAVVIDSQNRPTAMRTARVAKSTSNALNFSSFIHPTIMARTSWFRENLYSEDIIRAEDFDLWLRTFDRYTFHNMDDCLLYYRELGLSHIRKYILSSQGIRKAIIRIPSVSTRDKIGILFKTYLKDIIYTLANVVGMENILIRRRGIKLNEEELKNHSIAISRAIAE